MPRCISAFIAATSLERSEHRSTVGEFGSAGWSFGSAPGREELAREAGGGHPGDVAGPSELAPEDVRLDGVDAGGSEGGGVGDVMMP